MRQRFRFSLSWLFAATAMFAVVIHWYALTRRAEIAREVFLAAVADYGAGDGAYRDTLMALDRRRDAELAVPFADERDILRSYRNWRVYIGRIHRVIGKGRD
ncbi:MAG: hypothetical protein ACRDHZ_22130 [Ktedonobacteraceae bacterium]